MSLVDQLNLTSEEAKALLYEISADDPAGILNEEEDAFLFIEEEMIKFGGLQSASIEWAKVEENAKNILINKFKHLYVVRYLLQCWLREKSWDAHVRSSEFLTGFLSLFFDNSYPKPGKNGLIAKRRLLSTILDNLKSAFDDLDRQDKDKDFFEKYVLTLENLKEALEQAGLKKETLAPIEFMQSKLKTYMTEPAPAIHQSKTSSGQQKGKVLGEGYFSAPETEILFTSDERETRKTLLNLADMINQRDAYDPTGYMLRRYALWGWITSSPIVVDGQRTELRAVPPEISAMYEEALSSNAINPDLLKKIERSVVSSVYWFKGSYYAHEVAIRLEMNEVAQAIHYAAVRFVRRLPVMMDLQFNDKQPFMDEVTQKWIQKSVTSEQKNETVSADYKRLKKELSDLMEKKGVEAVLLQLEQKQSQKQSMRSQCQVIKITADLLAERGLKWFADELYQKVEKQMQETLATHWEPELFQEITKNKAELNQTVNDK